MSDAAETLCKAIRSAAGEQAVVLSYWSGFEQLWALDPRTNQPSFLGQCETGLKPVVIVWDPSEQPESLSRSDTLLLPHLSPLDWALCISIAYLSAGQNCRLSIAVVLAGEWQDYGDWSRRMSGQLLVDMPWVSLYSVAARPRTTSRAQVVQPLLGNWDPPTCEPLLLSDPSSSGWQISPYLLHPPELLDRPATLRLLRAHAVHWAMSIQQEDVYHDINNLVGARALLAGMGKHAVVRESMGMQAFIARLRWGEHLRAAPPGPWQRLRNVVDKLAKDAGGNVDLVIVDDMLDQGWGEVALTLFGLARPKKVNTEAAANFQLLGWRANSIALYGATSVDAIVEKLASASFDRRDFGFRLNQSSKSAPTTPEVLFLDLRLFESKSRDAFGSTIARLWYRIQAKVCSGAGLAWESLSQDAAAIDVWVNDSKRPEPPVEVITLLPRLLSLASPLLPIILFSSSGRTEVRERLKSYKNIFTAFEKPRVISAADAMSKSMQTLEQVLDEASQFCSAAYSLAQLNAYAKLERQFLLPSTGDDRKYVEIYLDEAGGYRSGNLKSIATVLMFESRRQADDMQEEVAAAVRDARRDRTRHAPSWVWWKDGNGGSPLPANRLKKLPKVDRRERGQKLEHGVRLLRPYFAKFGVEAFWVGLNQLNFCLGIARNDAEYDRMLRLNIEFIVHVLLPMCGVDECEWAVFLPSRVQPVSSEEEAYLERLRHGVDYFKGRDDHGRATWYLHTYSASSYYAFLREFEYRWRGSSRRLVAGRGVGLNCFENDWENFYSEEAVLAEWPRWLVGLADWVADVRHNGSGPEKDLLFDLVKDLRLTGALPSGPVPLERAIDAIREATLPDGSTTEMLADFLVSWASFVSPSTRKPPAPSISTLAHATYCRLHECLKRASGNDIIGAIKRSPVEPVACWVGSYEGIASVSQVFSVDADDIKQLAVLRLQELGDEEVVVRVAPERQAPAVGQRFHVVLSDRVGTIEFGEGELLPIVGWTG